MSADSEARALYLRAGGAPFFAMLHPPSGPADGRAVLICPPFGWQDMCSYRSRRDWAERLSAGGRTVLRIDLPGSGDSPGGPRDPGRLDAWTDAVSAGAAWLAGREGVERVAAIGIGLGGMLAVRAALGDAPIDELVLWAVPARGRTIVRELRAMAAMELASSNGGEPPDGALSASGYLMSPQTTQELSQLDLAALPAGGRAPLRALLLGRDGLPADQALVQALDRAGVQSEVADGPGYGAMMVEPQDARPPLAVFEVVDRWLASCAAAPAAPRAAAAAPVELGELGPRELGGSVRERPLRIEGPEGPMLGILAEPAGAPRELCAVLMNAGPQRRTGPNRMWVELARRWASQGVPTLRFDLAGIGDSDGDADALAQVASYYTPEYIGQALSALDALDALGLPRRHIAVGLCAGAYWSTNAALRSGEIAAVVMLNPRTLVWDQGVYGMRRARELRLVLGRRESWSKLLRGEITPARHLETLRALAVSAGSRARRAGLRLAGRARAGGDDYPVAAIFDELRSRGQRATLLFTGAEPLLREMTARGVTARIGEWPNLELRVLGTDVDTHTLTPPWLQREVHELLDEVLRRELGLLRDQPAGGAAELDESSASAI